MGDTAHTTRVVVADGDGPTRNLVRLVLAGERWSVREAADASSAVRTVAAEVPDVLVVDVDLPGAGGLATARALRRQPATAGIAVVLLTDARRPIAIEDVDAEVAVVLQRPFGAFALLDAVERARAVAAR